MKKLFTILAAVAFVVAFSVPAMAAAEWNFYGSARVGTWYTNVDGGPGVADNDGLTTWDLQGNSRVGANVKAGDIYGRFEYGVTNQTTGAHEAARVRLLYGTWNFGPGKLLVGKAYVPTFNLISNQVFAGDNDLLFYGGASGRVRQAQIALHMGGLKFALVEPNVNSYATTAWAGAVADTEVTIPQLEASYGFAFGPVKMTLFGGYHTYDDRFVNGLLDASSSIDSYVYGAVAKTTFGPIFLNGGINFGQNYRAYGWLHQTGMAPIRTYNNVTNVWTENDTDDWGFNLVAGFKVNDMLTFEAGYGYVETDMDNSLAEDEAATYYINATINLAKGCFIVPEIGKIDQKDVTNAAGVKTDQGDTMYFGAKWQINF